jgi:hypothetical protein
MESYVPAELFQDRAFQHASLGLLGKSLGIAAATVMTLALLVCIARRKPAAAPLVLGLALLEIVLFNRAYSATFQVDEARMTQVASAVAGSNHDYRISVIGLPNSAMSNGTLDAWGYDPFVPRRYAELFAFTQGVPLDTPAVDIHIDRWDPLFSLVRLRYIFIPRTDGSFQKEGPYPHLPRALLVPEYRTVKGAEAVLSALGTQGFDPSREVILEEPPPFKPQKARFQGTVQVRTVSTDEIRVEADVASPSILLLTDPFFPGWRAEGKTDSQQAAYPIMRADHILQAIPLQKGNHSIRIMFDPPGLTPWLAVSIGTAASMAAVGILLLVRRKSAGRG